MCGIAGLLLSPGDLQRVSVDDMIKTLALEIESRGRDATGVARLTASNRLRVTKLPHTATRFFSEHPQIGEGCRLALIHTRAATLGDPKAPGGINNHPLTSGPITLIHNGIIGNDKGIYTKYGWNRVGEVDSEVIPTAIRNLGWKEALELVEGSCAVAWHDMEKPGHLFVARHTTNPLHVGVSDSGSVVFASTNAAVAKAMAVLGSTSVTIDAIKEGAMIEFWTDDEGVLRTEINEFTPPKVVWQRSGSYEYEQGAWFRSGGKNATTRTTTGYSTGSTYPATSGTTVRGWDTGRYGYVLKVKDNVVFVPNDIDYSPIFGQLTHFGTRTGHAFVDLDFDWGVSDEVLMPLDQLLPVDVWDAMMKSQTPRAAEHPPLALPPVKVESNVEELDLVPKTLQELVDAIEEVFGAEALDLLPISWDDPDSEVYDVDNERDVIDVEEVSD